jgi:hypothetical protein
MTLDDEDLKFVREAQTMAWTTEGMNAMLWHYAQTKLAEEGINCSSCVTQLYKQLQTANQTLQDK